MSVSTDAILAYGISFNPEEDEGYDSATFESEKTETLEEQAAYWKHPVVLLMHCSDEQTMYIVASLEHLLIASRGFPKEVQMSMFQMNYKEIDKALRRFCDELVVPYQKPKWLLASDWR